MIKGINKRIIEVSDTGSDYFEKVLFIVKDNSADYRNLRFEADRVVNTYFPKSDLHYKGGYLRKRNKKRKIFVAVAITSLLTVFSVAAVLIKIFI